MHFMSDMPLSISVQNNDGVYLGKRRNGPVMWSGKAVIQVPEKNLSFREMKFIFKKRKLEMNFLCDLDTYS